LYLAEIELICSSSIKWIGSLDEYFLKAFDIKSVLFVHAPMVYKFFALLTEYSSRDSNPWVFKNSVSKLLEYRNAIDSGHKNLLRRWI
jgi:hypothetical protein